MDRREVATERERYGGGAKCGNKKRRPGKQALLRLGQYARIPAYIPVCVNEGFAYKATISKILVSGHRPHTFCDSVSKAHK